MPKLSLVYYGESDPERPFSGYLHLANIECGDLLEGLAILHERLNAVAMPRIYRSTSNEAPDAVTDKLRANDGFPTTVSC